MPNRPHIPVLLHEILEIFKPLHITTFIDGTVGAAGHAEQILEGHPEIERFIGIDQDPEAREIAQENLKPFGNKVQIIPDNFHNMTKIAKGLNLRAPNGILLDIGVSSMQLDRPEKGFSFMQDGPLDMRMDPNSPLTAETIVNQYTELQLSQILRDFGEEKQHKKIARIITDFRKEQPIKTTLELANLIEKHIKKNPKKKIHPATLTFQALRIAVNSELSILQDAIPEAINLLAPKGRLAIISFHSLEDRIVKNAFRDLASDKGRPLLYPGEFEKKEAQVKIITKKVICATEEEISLNPRSRCAKLRVVEKI